MAQNMRYQYGTSPRKLEPEIRHTRKTTNRKLETVKEVKRQDIKVSPELRKKQLKLTLVVVVTFITLLTISYRNSKINEQFSQIQGLKKELASIEKENEQTKVAIENGLNLNNIEKEAKEKLGMKKLTNKQIVYISLPKKDYVETPSEAIVMPKNENVFQKIINKIFNK